MVNYPPLNSTGNGYLSPQVFRAFNPYGTYSWNLVSTSSITIISASKDWGGNHLLLPSLTTTLASS